MATHTTPADVRSRATSAAPAGATTAIARGAEIQIAALDAALSGVNQMAASLRETAGQAESVSAAAEELASSVTEVAASIEQVTGNATNLASGSNQTAA